MIQPPDGGEGRGAPGRGLLLVAFALLLGIGVLAKVAPSVHSVAATNTANSGAASSTTTTAPAPPGAVSAPTSTTSAPAPSTTTTTAGSSHRSTTTTTSAGTHPPSTVKVIVANGTSTPGVAGKLKSKLQAAGYNVLAPQNTTTPARASSVYYAAGYQADGQAVAVDSGLSASASQPMSGSVPVANGSSAQIVVVIGPDMATSLSGGH